MPLDKVLSTSIADGAVSNSALQSNLSLSGNVNFSSTGARITGDTNNATISNRLFFQSSTTNGSTSFGVLPNGTSLVSGYQAYDNSDPTNAAFAQLATSAGTEVRLTSGITGTGTYLPMTFYTNGSERMRIDTAGGVGIGTSSYSEKLSLNGNVRFQTNNKTRIEYLNSTAAYSLGTTGGAAIVFEHSSANHEIAFETHWTGNSHAEQMRITKEGNLKFNSGYGSVATAYGCRAWVNFNGTGVVAIRASGNVTSITDNGTGDYTVNFTNAMPDVNYSIVGSSGSGNAYGSYAFNNPGAGARFAVGSCRINSFITQSAGLADVDTVCVSVFR